VNYSTVLFRQLIPSAEGREPFVFPEVEFLELTVNCDSAVEGWLILPIADLSPALRF
jgi:hypothetical protein